MIYRFSHPEWFDGIEKPNLTPEDTIILWGAGKVGSVVAHAIKKRGLRVEAFVDIAKDKQGTKYCGCKVISPVELYEKYADAIIIVSCAYPSVLRELLSNGRRHVYDPHSLLLEVDFDGYYGGLTYEFACRITSNALANFAMYYGTDNKIEKIFFAITEKCSLNCLNCDGYIPYHMNPVNDNPHTIFECYNRITNVSGTIGTVELFGGEPLLHPDITEIARFFVDDNRCEVVSIISNGTILPDSHLCEILKSPKCILRISDYGTLSRRKDDIIALCRNEHVNCEITNYQYWDNIPLIQRMDESVDQLNAKYASCVRNYFYVKHGKLFQCPFTVGISSLGEQLLPDFEKNYVDLLQADDHKVSSQIQKFLLQIYEQQHLDACKYCPGSHCLHFENKVPVAEQANGKLPLDLLFKDGVRLCD